MDSAGSVTRPMKYTPPGIAGEKPRETKETRPRIPRRPLIVVAWLMVAALLGVVAWRVFSAPTSVKTARADHGEIIAEVFGTGTLESKVMVGMSSKITGRVVAVLVDQGETVTVGQALARLDDKDFGDGVRAAVAQREQVEVILAKAKADLDRQRSLVARDFITRAEFEAYEAAYHVAESQSRAAEATVGVARAKLADTYIISPTSGRIATRNLEVGSTVVPGSPIFRIAASVPWVVAHIDERATGDLRPGQPTRVVFETAPSVTMVGRVARLATEVDRVTEEREVDVRLDRLPRDWFLGQVADVYVETARKGNALRVPPAAIVVQEGASGVFAIVDGRAQWRPVQLGLRGRNFVEVISGVSERDEVVLSPLAGKSPISNGGRVAVAPKTAGL